MNKLIILHKKKFLNLALLAALIFIIGFSIKPSVQTVFKIATADPNRLLPIYCVERSDNKISISFDAAWGADDTDKLLQILKDNDVKATFFLCGYWIDKYPDEVKKIIADGHDVGNHGNTRAHGAKLNLEQNKQEILKAHEKIKNLTGTQMFLFRPPYGEYNNTVIKAANEVNYYPIQWDVDSLDWKNYGVDSIIKTVTQHKHLGNGSIILCHNGAQYTAEALDTLITTLKDAGYEFVPISELIIRENYHMDHEGRQIPD